MSINVELVVPTFMSFLDPMSNFISKKPNDKSSDFMQTIATVMHCSSPAHITSAG